MAEKLIHWVTESGLNDCNIIQGDTIVVGDSGNGRGGHDHLQVVGHVIVCGVWLRTEGRVVGQEVSYRVPLFWKIFNMDPALQIFLSFKANNLSFMMSLSAVFPKRDGGWGTRVGKSGPCGRTRQWPASRLQSVRNPPRPKSDRGCYRARDATHSHVRRVSPWKCWNNSTLGSQSRCPPYSNL